MTENEPVKAKIVMPVLGRYTKIPASDDVEEPLEKWKTTCLQS